MKEINPASWIYWFGLFTVMCMLLPVLAVLLKHRFGLSYTAIMIYYISTFLYNLILIAFPQFPTPIRRIIGITNNLIDAPMMLLFFLHFTHSPSVRKIIKITFIVFLGFELVVIVLKGYTVNAISIVAGPGILLVLAFAFYFFSHHIRTAIGQKTGIPKTVMISGILFSYGVYFLVYILYYILQTPHKADALIIYFLASLVGAALVAAGLFKENSVRIKKATPLTGIAFER